MKLEQAAREVVRQHSMECLSDKAVDALREALAEPDIEEMTLTQIAARHEQAEPEQYPTYGFCPICGSRGISRERRINGNDTCANGHSYASNLALHIAPEKQAEQEPVAWASFDNAYSKACNSSNPQDWMEAALLAQQIRTSPVRTKDLTDDEIMKINVDTASIVPTCDRQFHFARAVIAADREKNK